MTKPSVSNRLVKARAESASETTGLVTGLVLTERAVEVTTEISAEAAKALLLVDLSTILLLFDLTYLQVAVVWSVLIKPLSQQFEHDARSE